MRGPDSLQREHRGLVLRVDIDHLFDGGGRGADDVISEEDRERLVPGVEARAAATVVQAFGGDPDLARAAWAFAHGMTILELDDRFPPDADLDAAWAAGIEALRTGIARTRPGV